MISLLLLLQTGLPAYRESRQIVAGLSRPFPSGCNDALLFTSIVYNVMIGPDGGECWEPGEWYLAECPGRWRGLGLTSFNYPPAQRVTGEMRGSENISKTPQLYIPQSPLHTFSHHTLMTSFLFSPRNVNTRRRSTIPTRVGECKVSV